MANTRILYYLTFIHIVLVIIQFNIVSHISPVAIHCHHEETSEGENERQVCRRHSADIYITQVSEVKIQYSMPSVQVGLVMPFCDCQQ